MVEWNHRNAAVTAVAFDSASYVASAAEDGTVASATPAELLPDTFRF